MMMGLHAWVWLILVTNIIVSFAAGEICIRYSVWWWVLRHRREMPTATPVIGGVAVAAFSMFFIELNYIFLRAQPNYMEWTAGNVPVEIARIVMLLAALCLALPVAKVHYDTRGRMWLDWLIRGFLVIMSSLATWASLAVYHSLSGSIC